MNDVRRVSVKPIQVVREFRYRQERGTVQVTDIPFILFSNVKHGCSRFNFRYYTALIN